MEKIYRGIFSVLGGILLFGLSILMLQGSPNNIFFWFLASLFNHFIIAHILYTLVFFVIAYGMFSIIYEGSCVDDPDALFTLNESDCKPLAISSSIAFFFILFALTPVGKKFAADFSFNCYSVFCQSAGKIGPIGEGLFYILGSFGTLIFIITFPIAMAFAGVALGAAFPTFVAGIIALSHHNKFQSAIKRTLPLDRPDRAIERELAQIMRDNLVNEQQVEDLISSLSPLNQWVRRIQYRKRMQDARRLREMAKAKYGALGEEGDLALRIHDIEGARRERDHWGKMR